MKVSVQIVLEFNRTNYLQSQIYYSGLDSYFYLFFWYVICINDIYKNLSLKYMTLKPVYPSGRCANIDLDRFMKQIIEKNIYDKFLQILSIPIKYQKKQVKITIPSRITGLGVERS